MMLPKTAWGSKSVIAVMSAARPLFPHEQTFAGTHRTAVSCQKLPYAVHHTVMLLDHLVGYREHVRRDSEAKRLGSLHVDDQLKLARLHDRQVRWLRTIQDPGRIDADLAIGFGQTIAVAHQPALHHIFPKMVHGRQFLLGRYSRRFTRSPRRRARAATAARRS